MNETRILYIIDELGPGGAERRLVQLLKGLDPARFSTKAVLLTDIVHYREVYELETEIITLERKIRKDPSIFLRLYKICRRWMPHIVHAWGSMPAVYAGPVAKLLGIKLVNAMIADAPARLNRTQKLRSLLAFPFSDVIQSNSRAGLESYGVPEAKRHVVHNGFDFERIGSLKEGGEVRDELRVTTRFVAGMVAGFKFQKDYDSLVRAAEMLIGRRTDISFVCVGDGPDLERIKASAGGSDRIIFTGKRSDVESIIGVFDIGILLTDLDRHGEGISNSIMEYMALGKPVIATNGGGTGELVVDGETGYLIPQKSPGMLAERIDLLLNNDRLRKEMGARGRKRIQEEFSIEEMVRGHTELYERLLERRR
ncbi:MAG TPA: glycosyltransferase [Candidatus Eisenbacteria bacterium]|uniref:Glycosyltransferase n=1 Tax=Eiseniibacteriota bacterium TaxID=2212470 RepID=A0A7V2AVP1_UNCEI|nr:glycosyltransferase [Candidatus Eisenbacteria bacterium]